jgi:hypothetical protein
MALSKKLVVGAINITIHPHSPKKYINLIKYAGKKQIPIKIRKNLFGSIGNVHSLSKHPHDENATPPIMGNIYKYIDIDIEGNWFDIETRDLASDKDKESIYIPKKLKPNLDMLSFIFYPDEHLMVYESYETKNSITPQYAEKIIRESLNSDELITQYGIVNVKHHPETDKVDEIINLKDITSIYLETRRPNPDGLNGAEVKFKKRMEKLNAKTEIREYKADDSETLKPDNELKTDIRIAARNGEASIIHIDDNSKKVTHSTKSHPLMRTDFYDPEKILLQHTFVNLANKIRKHLSVWVNKDD